MTLINTKYKSDMFGLPVRNVWEKSYKTLSGDICLILLLCEN
jgi:hypothetical protein